MRLRLRHTINSPPASAAGGSEAPSPANVCTGVSRRRTRIVLHVGDLPAGLGAHEREGTERGGCGVYVPSLHEGGPAALRPLLLRRRLRVGRRRVALLRVPLLRWVSLLRVALLRWVALLRRRVARGRVSRRRVRVLPGVTCEIQRRERNTHASGGYGTRRERRS
jgi:hypothetical protein